MRTLRFSVFFILVTALALLGMTPRKIFAQKQSQTTAPKQSQATAQKRMARRHVVHGMHLRTQVVPQQSGGSPVLVTTPSVFFQDKQGLDGSGTPFIIPVTNTSTTTTVQVSSVSTDNDLFNVSTTCTTVAPGGSCTITLSASVQSDCDFQEGDIFLDSNDAGGGELDILADVYGADNNFNITNLTDSSLTPAKLAAALVGTGVTVSNVQYTGAAVAAGTFSSDANIIGFNNGIILSSGSVRNVIGPNCDFGITAENNIAGDDDLSNLIGQDTFDASVLEFDFIPTNPTIRFQYVFASDEYEAFVFDFNDVFAFFVNGNNVALIPQTNTLVSINTVNNGNNGQGDHPEYAGIPPVNPMYYINNDLAVLANPPLDTEMNGTTVVLTATAQVNPGVTNHIKLAIADALDTDVDSNVFIKAGSLSSSIVSLSPTGLAFGATNVGSQSTAQTVTLTNVGNAGLSGVSVSPDSNNFTVSDNTCGTTVAAGGTCTLSVSFSPQSDGEIQGTLNFTDSAGDSPQPLTLAGRGVEGPFATLSATSLLFPLVGVENSAPPQTVTITNTGTAPLIIGSVFTANLPGTGDFVVSQQNCVSGDIAVNGSCTVQVTWTNLAEQTPESDQLVVQDNGQGGQQIVALVGGATQSTVAVTGGPLNFGNQAVNTTSAAQTVTVMNTGTSVVVIPSILVPAGFSETDNCTTSGGLQPPGAPGQTSCMINVTFTPTSATTFAGLLTITDSAQGGPHTVMLSGTGTSGAPTLASIAVTPNPASVAVNGTQQFTATGTYSDHSTKDITAQSSWTSSDTEIATVGAATGLATGMAAGGPVTITAVNGNIVGTASLTVTSGPTLRSIAVTPNPATIALNGTQQFSATGTYSDDSTKDLTTQSTWRSSNTEVATIGAGTGLATGVGVGGPITITATDGEVSGTASLSVSNAPIQITIPPPPGGTFGPVNPGGLLPVGVVLTSNPGTTGTVTFSCTTSSPTITCQPVPATVSLTPGGPLQVAIVVNTYCRGTTNAGFVAPGGLGGGFTFLLLTAMMGGLAWAWRRNPRWALSFGMLALLAFGGVACNSLPRGPNGATPPGDYTLTISATINGQTVTANPVLFHVN